MYSLFKEKIRIEVLNKECCKKFDGFGPLFQVFSPKNREAIS